MFKQISLPKIAIWARIIGIVSILALLFTSLHLRATKEILASPEKSGPNVSSSSAPAWQVTATPTATLSLETIPSAQSTPTLSTQPEGPTATFSFALATLGYDDTTLGSPSGSASYSFRVPESWLIQDESTLNLDMSYTYNPLGSTDILTPTTFGNLTVMLNNEILTTIRIEEGRFENRQVRIPLPASELNDPSSSATIQLLFDAGFLCEVPHDAALTIHSTSVISLAHNEIPLEPDISRYPRPFVQRAFEPDIVRFVLPAEPGPTDLTNAIDVAAKLENLGGNIVISPTTDLDLEESISSGRLTVEDEHLIVIGQPENNRLLPLLNELTDLPVSLHRRRLEIAAQGPPAIAPGETFTNIFTITNTIDQELDLSIANNISLPLEFLDCASNCSPTEDERTLAWNNVVLAPDETINLTVTLKAADTLTRSLRLDNTLTVIDAELGPLNAQTLVSEVDDDPDGGLQSVTADQGDYFFMYRGQAVAEGDGIVQEIVSPWNNGRVILIITGLNDEALGKAGQAMSSEARFPGIHGPVAIVQDVLTSSEINDTSPPLTTGTFEALGYEDEILSGQGSPEARYELYVPHDWVLTNEAFLDIQFHHSQIIDYDASNLSVSVNNRPAASFFLNEESAEDGHSRVDLGEARIQPGLNRVSIQANMSLEAECLEDQSDQVWLLIENDSTFHLAHQEISNINFSLSDFPLPFTLDSSLANILFVLPENPTTLEWGTALNIAGGLGRNVTSQTIIPQVMVGDEPLTANLTDFHIIAIGRPSRNALIQEINDDLPQSFIPGSDSIEQKINNVIFRLPPDVDLGYVQFLASPWNESRAILVVTGTTDEGLQSAETSIVNRSNTLAGNLALIQDEAINILDTRELTTKGAAVAVATSVASTALGQPQVATTITPTEVSTVSQSSAARTSGASNDSTGPNRPGWFIPLVGINSLIILAIVAFVVWRAFKRRIYLR